MGSLLCSTGWLGSHSRQSSCLTLKSSGTTSRSCHMPFYIYIFFFQKWVIFCNQHQIKKKYYLCPRSHP
ncbi:mCG148355 [Mus musculus]|nr:mCG148355 [Mus musculus]